MLRLLKVDLTRIIKDKLFIVICIIGGIFAISTPIMMFVLLKIIGGENMELLEAFGLSVTGKTLFFNSFSLTNNFGIILPIFVCVIIFKDFSYGTIKNKIICGHSRVKIFGSIFLSTFITLFSAILVHALLTLGLSLIFLPYQSEPFVFNDFLYLIESLGFLILAYLFISAVIAFISVFVKNVGLSIVCYLAFAILLTVVSSIVQVGIGIFMIEENQTLVDLLTFLNNINIFYSITGIIGKASSYSTSDVLYLTLTPLISSALFGGLGLLRFVKKDI